MGQVRHGSANARTPPPKTARRQSCNTAIAGFARQQLSRELGNQIPRAFAKWRKRSTVERSDRPVRKSRAQPFLTEAEEGK